MDTTWNNGIISDHGMTYGNGKTIFHFSDDTEIEQTVFTGDEIRKDPKKLFAIDYNNVIFDEAFIREFEFDIAWNMVNIRQKLSIDFIREFATQKDADTCHQFWNWISFHFPFDDKVVDEFKDQIDWILLSQHHRFNEAFIRKYQDKLNWSAISRYQKLSENFIREFREKVIWHSILKYQDLSEKFMDEMSTYITDIDGWDDVGLYQKVSSKFLKKHNINLGLTFLWNDKYKTNKIDSDSVPYETRIKDLTDEGFIIVK